jgi:hypothetical protein
MMLSNKNAASSFASLGCASIRSFGLTPVMLDTEHEA